jgi:E3 ubiquitin-protein ligase SHPRH
MVALIPRANSLAISGTPAKTDIRDLMGSLRFLRVPDLPYNPKMWHRLQQPAMRSAFEGLFRELAIRTTKAEVQSEFHLPPQNRYVVPLTLSPIERHYYNDTLERQRAIIGREGQEGVNNATLRQCLLTLRQICTHIQVGYLDNQRAAGRRMNLGNTLLKSMDEALKKMKGENAAQLLNDTKLHVRYSDSPDMIWKSGRPPSIRKLTARLALWSIERISCKLYVDP